MNTHRLNITIPKEIMSLLKSKPNKSAFIAEALSEKFAAEKRARREEELARAYREAALEDKGLIKEWDAAAGDGL